MASVAEVKTAIDAALVHVDPSGSPRGIRRHPYRTLAVAVEGSGHDAVSAARAALTQGARELADAHPVVEQARTYAAAL